MKTNPQRIPHSKRQRVTTGMGTVLERAYIFMPPESWAALRRLSIVAHRSNSQIIEQLIAAATCGGTAHGGNQVKEIYAKANNIQT